MPKPMLNQSTKTNNKLSFQNNAPNLKIKQNVIERQLRKRRSMEYMKTLSHLDAGEHIDSDADNTYAIIASEFPEISLGGYLLGIVSKCYLGDPYEVHTLDMTSNIIDHYEVGRSLPPELEKARRLACNPNYDLIEVFVDCCCAVDGMGNVSVIKSL